MPNHPIRFGLQTGQQNVEWPQMLDLWRKADGWGYDSLWNYDHFYPIFTNPEGDCLEGWTTLSALAQATHKARIGHLVNGNTYRHPSVLAKMAATLDHISGGRLNLGIGAGWFELEHTALGFEFGTFTDRFEKLEEALQIIIPMLRSERVTFTGRHYTVDNAINSPPPLSRIPLMIGGSEEDVALARPVIEAIASKILHVGPSGAGNVAKLVNNMLVAAHMLTTSEALRLAAAAGVDPRSSETRRNSLR